MALLCFCLLSLLTPTSLAANDDTFTAVVEESWFNPDLHLQALQSYLDNWAGQGFSAAHVPCETVVYGGSITCASVASQRQDVRCIMQSRSSAFRDEPSDVGNAKGSTQLPLTSGLGRTRLRTYFRAEASTRTWTLSCLRSLLAPICW